ncbi:unnamed protein product [Candidula unifasciata]|uniref:Fucosyltransferase n=1 Tax=Candidula unifasciata TaxID=100452 RepID=A0A8S3YQR9_9EUPU|nr:unnamed protein product [Candidula unifasciata]
MCSLAENKDSPSVSIKPKLVLFYKFPVYYELASAAGFDIFKSCSKTCELTVNSTRFAEADVVVFFSHSHIIWVFFSVESPPNSAASRFGNEVWHGLFNWTMSYRHDSEFWHGYVRSEKRKQPVANETRAADEKTWRELFSKKQGLVAWFVSNCQTDSRREMYVTELMKHIPVDIYGTCGTLKCTEQDKCVQMLRTKYKFYLAFENSLCKDYVTEKLLKIYNIGGLIPVVRGGADYHKLFPPNSFIDTSDFSSPKSLANHLHKLADNEDAYLNMLRWSWDYQVLGPKLPLCKLCERLYEPKRVSCVYKNVYAWWSDKICHAPRDL